MKLRKYKHARRFLTALRPSNRSWLPDSHWVVQWVFRGQRIAGWELTPSAWRSEITRQPLYRHCEESVSRELAVATREQWRSDLEEHLAVPGNNSNDLRGWLEAIPHLSIERVHQLIVQHRFEFLSVRQFLEVSDDIGLPIVTTHFSRYSPVPITYDPLPIEDEQKPFEPVIALAQHHGCPTRLLDWTHSPETAAFFAAEQTQQGDGELAVWALDLRYLSVHGLSVKPFSVPRSAVGYLHAQKGLFTYVCGADLSFIAKGVWPTVEAICSRALVKLTLPWRETGELRRLLFAEGFHRAALMPTYDNVTEMLKQHQQTWNRGD